MSKRKKTTQLVNTENMPVRDSKEEKFLELIGEYRDWKRAAVEAGYSGRYADEIRSRKMKQPAFVEKLIRRYGANSSIARLPQLQGIRDEIYRIVEEDPTKEPQFKHVFKQDLQIAGVLSEDHNQSSTVINIGGIRELMVQVGQERRCQLDNSQTIEAEIEE